MSRGSFLGWTMVLLVCSLIWLALLAAGHQFLALLWLLACIRKWWCTARGIPTMLVWILSVQLVNPGPVYRFRVDDCSGFGQYVEELLAWDQRARMPVDRWGAASCAWWQAMPPELQDVSARRVL